MARTAVLDTLGERLDVILREVVYDLLRSDDVIQKKNSLLETIRRSEELEKCLDDIKDEDIYTHTQKTKEDLV